MNAPLFKSLGGELLGYWYGPGGVTYYVLRPASWRRMATASSIAAGPPAAVIHFSTSMLVHSCAVVSQHVYLNHPQVYTQDANLARPGLA